MQSHLTFRTKALGLDCKGRTTGSHGGEGSQRRTEGELEWERMSKVLIGKCLLPLGLSPWDFKAQGGKCGQ